jgi:hypothetical protein
MFFKRATLPLIFVFTFGLVGFALMYVPHPWATKNIWDEVNSWFEIIGGFGLFIGVYSLLHMHITRIRRKVAGWGYSIFVFIGAGSMIVMGLYNGGYGPMVDNPKDMETTWFQWGFKYVLTPCAATIFSILAFYIASAAFRTFRAKNLAAGLLLLAAIIVMFGRVPISETVSEWLFNNKNVFTNATDIIMEGPNLAAKRAIILGISLGAISQSVRILLGIERSYLGGGE